MRWCVHVAAVGTRLDHIGTCFWSRVGVFPCRSLGLAANGCFDSISGGSNTAFVGGSEAKRYEDVVGSGSCGDQSRDMGNSKLIHWHVSQWQ